MRIARADQFPAVKFPLMGDFLAPVFGFLRAEGGGNCPIKILGALAAVIAGAVVVREPRAFRIPPRHLPKMPAARAVEAFGQFGAGTFAKNFWIHPRISFVRDEMQHLLQRGVKAPTGGICLGGKLSLAMMETGILKHIVIEAIQRALILGNGHKRIALHQFRHHHRIVRLAVLVTVQILRQHDGNMEQLVRRCFGSAKKMNPENARC